MNIQLKNIKVYERLSEETTAYSADLFVDGKKIAECQNDGHGGCDRIHAFGRNEKEGLSNNSILHEAEKFCTTLPDNVWKSFNGQDVQEPMTLEVFIGNLLTDFLLQKDIAKFKKKMEKDMDKGILVGKDSEYALYKTNAALSTINFSDQKNIDWLNNQLQKISAKLKKGERILNTNFPEGVVIPEPVKA